MNEAPPFHLAHHEERDEWVLTLGDGGGGTLSAVLPESVVDALAQRITSQRLQADNGLQFQVTAVTYENLGDSAAFVRRPVRHDPTESIQSLVMRAHNLGSPYHRHHAGDRLEVQVIPESIPEATGGKGLLDF